MQNTDVHNLTEASRIYYSYEENRVVLTGKKLWICLPTGQIIACREDIPNAHKLLFLPQKQLLICGGNGTTYRLVSMEDGSDIWTVPQIKKLSTCGSHFSVSPDGKYAFDFYEWHGQYCLVRIDLLSGLIDTFALHGGLRALQDITCNQEGNLLLLRAQIDKVDAHDVCRSEIRQVNWDTRESARLNCWQSDLASAPCGFANASHSILTKNLRIIEMPTAEKYSLLENNATWKQPGLGPHSFWFTVDGKYICIAYDNANVIIDLQTRKIVAQYPGYFFRGCLIGDEYWVPTGEGVVRKRFPLIENIPPRKLSYF